MNVWDYLDNALSEGYVDYEAVVADTRNALDQNGDHR